MRSSTLARALMTMALLMSPSTFFAQQPAEYALGPQDVLSITIWGPGGVSDNFTIEADGTFLFPMLGRVKAGGLTVRRLQDDLTGRLREGYFTDPRVTVSIENYNSQRIFVIGEVKSPGAYSLTRSMTLVEALTLAGSTTGNAGGIALVRRRTDGETATGPVTKGGDGIAELRVDLTALQEGILSENPVLRNGDTIAVPRLAPIFVFGHVSRPGEYTVGKEANVRQVLALAGGVAQRGAVGRIKIVRVISGHAQEFKANLDDRVQPGDTIIVPERYF